MISMNQLGTVANLTVGKRTLVAPGAEAITAAIKTKTQECARNLLKKPPIETLKAYSTINSPVVLGSMKLKKTPECVAENLVEGLSNPELKAKHEDMIYNLLFNPKTPQEKKMGDYLTRNYPKITCAITFIKKLGIAVPDYLNL